MSNKNGKCLPAEGLQAGLPARLVPMKSERLSDGGSNAWNATLGTGGSPPDQELPAFAFAQGGCPPILIFNFPWTF
jgi:hypothetical protein